MKIKTVFFSLLIALSYSSVAQIFIGPTAGPNISWVSFNDPEHRDIFKVRPVVGFHAGINMSFKVRNRFFLHSSLIYSQKGKAMRNKADNFYSNEVRYNYIELPILYAVDFKGTIGNNKVFKWYCAAGPNLSYWLGGKGTFSSSNLNEVTIDELEYKIVFKKSQEELGAEEMSVQEPNRMQLGLNLASGIVFEPIEYRKIMLNVRYELGHSFLSRTTEGIFLPTFETDPMRVRNHGFRVSLIYMGDLKLDQRKKGKSTIKRKKVR